MSSNEMILILLLNSLVTHTFKCPTVKCSIVAPHVVLLGANQIQGTGEIYGTLRMGGVPNTTLILTIGFKLPMFTRFQM